MTKENKQFTELSDEDLKNVNGGKRNLFVTGFINDMRCPEGVLDENGKCPQINID